MYALLCRGYFIYLNWIPSYFYQVLVPPVRFPDRAFQNMRSGTRQHDLLGQAQHMVILYCSSQVLSTRDVSFQVLGLDLRASAFVSLLPWVVMAVGSSASGALADGLVASGVAVVKVRKVQNADRAVLLDTKGGVASQETGSMSRGISRGCVTLLLASAKRYVLTSRAPRCCALAAPQALQTIAFLGPAVALTLLSRPGISHNMAIGCMTAALGITSLGGPRQQYAQLLSHNVDPTSAFC